MFLCGIIFLVVAVWFGNQYYGVGIAEEASFIIEKIMSGYYFGGGL
jgi:hypothetical protein